MAITYDASGVLYDDILFTYEGGAYTEAPDERLIPMNWAPRWMDAYYNDGSLLKNMYFQGIAYPQDQLQQIIADTLYPKFWGKLGQCRALFATKYFWPKGYIPVIHFVGPTGTGQVVFKDNIGTLLYEKVDYVYTVFEGKIILKNLPRVIHPTHTTASGTIDCQAEVVDDPPMEDSLFILENSFGDRVYIDQTDWRYNNGVIDIGIQGNFQLYWMSQSTYTQILSGDYYLLIDGKKASLHEYFVDNVWDSYAFLHSIERQNHETNLSLGEKCRQLSVSQEFAQRLGAALGTSQFFRWGTAAGSTFSLSGSGAIDFELIDSPLFHYISEAPFKNGDNWVLSWVPESYVQVFLNDRKVETSSFIVSGNVLVSVSNTLKQADFGQVTVSYKTLMFTSTTSGDLVTQLTSNHVNNKSVLGVYSTNLKVTSSSKRIETFRWNKSLGLLSGTADFDF